MSIEQEFGQILLDKNLTISTAESCTGGLVSSLLTDIPGSSAFITLNVVTYANEIKHKILNVSLETLNTHGAVSKECATEMVLGLKQLTNSDVCLATTGIAGPSGGTKDKPVGLCYVAFLYDNNLKIKKLLFPPNTQRKELKLLFAKAAIEFAKQNL